MTNTDLERVYEKFMAALWGIAPDASWSAVGDSPFVGRGRSVSPGLESRLTSVCTAEVVTDLTEVFHTLHEGFPDAEVATDDPGTAADRISVRWTVRGTHKGTFADFPPTGKRIWFTGIVKLRVAGGLIDDVRWTWDTRQIREQLSPGP